MTRMPSDLIQSSPPISDLFANLGHNWSTLSPVLSLLFGIIFATYVVNKILKKVRGEDD
ncbi:hypothetical protein D3C76_316240 [compost metagenome]